MAHPHHTWEAHDVCHGLGLFIAVNKLRSGQFYAKDGVDELEQVWKQGMDVNVATPADVATFKGIVMTGGKQATP